MTSSVAYSISFFFFFAPQSTVSTYNVLGHSSSSSSSYCYYLWSLVWRYAHSYQFRRIHTQDRSAAGRQRGVSLSLARQPAPRPSSQRRISFLRIIDCSLAKKKTLKYHLTQVRCCRRSHDFIAGAQREDTDAGLNLVYGFIYSDSALQLWDGAWFREAFSSRRFIKCSRNQ